ncbi:hypothetical protein HPY86_03880 [candidate division WOR-3 bacterium]|nr:hypothetical protein [candidate division WOR-3 bacterium]
MQLRNVVRRLQEIRDRGFVESLRKGPTGIGYTFETLFGVIENNIPIPDIGGRVEIKTVRKDSQSLITLFTFNKGVWRVNQRDLIERFGYVDERGRYALKNTIFFRRPIPQGLSLNINETKNTVDLIVRESGTVIATWDVYVIVGKFMAKMSRLLIVMADRKVEQGREYFHYNEAYILQNPTSRSIISAFKNSLIGIDLRMHLKENGAVRNRGTAFRIKEQDLVNLYESRNQLI